jgi:hypothetical protein
VLAALNLESGLLDEAGSAFRRLGPLGGAERAALGRAWLDRGDPVKALDVIGEIPRDAMTAGLLRIRASALLEIGRPDEAASVLKAIPGPTAEDRIALARAESLAGRLDSATEVLRAVLASDPGHAEARAAIVRLCMLQGLVGAARADVAAGLVLTPRHPALIRALDDVIPELAPPEAATIAAVLHDGTLVVDGARVEADPAAGLRQLRAIRLSLAPGSPSVRVLLAGRTEGAALARALDLLTAAGFSRVWIESERR